MATTSAPSGNISLPTGSTDIGTNGTFDTGLNDGLGSMDFTSINGNATPEFLAEKLIEYHKAPSTKAFAGIPRFGHTNEFSYLAYLSSDNGDTSDGQDYISGLLFTGCFLLAFFLVWTIVIFIFKFCLNGFLSGEPFINPNLDDPAEQKRRRDLEEDGEEYVEDSSWLKRPRRIRIVFFICGFLQIVFAILLVTKGVANLQDTTDTVQISTDKLRLLVDDAITTSENLKQVGDTGFMLRDQIVFDLDKDNFCPDNPIFEETQAGKSILTAAEGAADLLTQLGDFIGEDIASLEESLDDVQRNLDEIDNSVAEIESNEWLGGLVAFPFLVLASLMMAGALAAQLHAITDCFLCVLNWFVLPAFVFVTVLSYLTLSLSSIVVSMNADLCGGKSKTPDQVIIDFMFRSGFETDDLMYETVRYYAFQCTSEAQTDPFLFLRSFDDTIAQGREVVQNFTDTMEEMGLDQLSLGCNRDFLSLHRSLGQMVGILDALVRAVSRAVELLQCNNVVPIYTDIIYDATCKYSITGFTWIFSSLLIISVMGMIMIMFRSSFQNTVFERPPALMDESSGASHIRTTTSRPGADRKKKKGRDDDREDRWNDEDE